MELAEQSSETGAQKRRRRVSSIIENHLTLAEIAEETNTSEQTARNEMDRLAVPYLKFGNVRFYNRDDVKRALLSRVTDKGPRRRGRPPSKRVA